MITDTDIKKLKGVFATKADLKAMRDAYAAQADVEELKADVKKLDFRFTQLDISLLKFETRIEVLMSRVTERINDLHTSMDAVAKGMDVEKSEYTAIGLQLDRHVNNKNVHSKVRS